MIYSDLATDACIHNGNLILPTVVPILHYALNSKDASDWASGGTGLLVNTGEKHLLVTADHVMRGYFDNQSYFTLIGGNQSKSINISDWNLVDCCDKRDIYTIEVPASFEPEIIRKRFCCPQQWPCSRVTKGEEAFFLGFPSGHRSGGSKEIKCGVALISEIVASVQGPNFVLVNEDSPRNASLLNEFQKFPQHFGGMSGAPVFVHRDDGWMEPVGVFVEGNGKDSPFFCSYMDIIQASGKLEKII